MINFQELEKVAEFKNGELNWLEGRDINAVYVILVGDEYYIGSSHYTYLRIGQHLHNLKSGVHHSGKFQAKFNKVGEFEVFILERGIEKEKLLSREYATRISGESLSQGEARAYEKDLEAGKEL